MDQVTIKLHGRIPCVRERIRNCYGRDGFCLLGVVSQGQHCTAHFGGRTEDCADLKEFLTLYSFLAGATLEPGQHLSWVPPLTLHLVMLRVNPMLKSSLYESRHMTINLLI